MVLMVMGVVVPGTKAIFCCPTIPGPDIKKPKTSLKVVPTNSGYSSEAKIKLNDTELLRGKKLNCKTAASCVTPPGRALSVASPAVKKLVVCEPLPLGPGVLLTAPVDSTMPSEIPIVPALLK